MKHLITSNFKRPGKTLAVLPLVAVILVWLLSVWGGLATAEARDSATARLGSEDLSSSRNTTANTIIFLPIVYTTDVVFADDFSDKNSGWPHKKSYEDCYFEYLNGHYRIKITDNDSPCIVPNFKIPRQFYGTFKIRVRRTSDTNDRLVYGFIFDAGPDATEEEGTRWSLEIYPNEYDSCDSKPFFWVIALKDGESKFRNYEQPPDDHECTSFIETNEDKWNQLAVVRDGRRVKVYIYDDGPNQFKLVGDYDNVPLLAFNEQNAYGYFNLRVASFSSDDVTIEFDDLEILRSVDFPQ